MKCRYCENEIGLRYGDKINAEMKEMQACFTCRHWLENKRLDENLPWYRGLVKNGRHYRARNIGPEKDPRRPDRDRGMGGTHYILTNLETGEQVETFDLWHQGEIPDHFRHLFPDNAKIEPFKTAKKERRIMTDISCPECRCIAGHEANCSLSPEVCPPGTRKRIAELEAALRGMLELDNRSDMSPAWAVEAWNTVACSHCRALSYGGWRDIEHDDGCAIVVAQKALGGGE
jgi:hypothetical protein